MRTRSEPGRSTFDSAAHDALFKVDHPRWIDRYIDFFGSDGVERGFTLERPEPLARASSL